nr:DUF4214 domain-containing protein [Pseudomonas luteola]
MALQYDAPTSTANFTSALTANAAISTATLEAITDLLGGGDTVAVGSFNGTTLQAPEGVQAVVANIPGSAGQTVELDLPETALDTASVWVLNSNANLSVNFDTTAASASELVTQGALVTKATADTTVVDLLVVGGNGNDTITTAAGDDTVVSGLGQDTVDGGEGFDVVQINGASSNYSFAVENGTLVATSTDGKVSVTAENVEAISFGETDNVMIATNEADAQALRLYETLLDRAPDIDGAKYWLNDIDQGQSIHDLAASFIASNEFQNLGTISNEAFIEQVYQNGLGRSAEAEGVAYWLNDLANGQDRADVAISIVGSPEAADAIQSVVIVTGQV